MLVDSMGSGVRWPGFESQLLPSMCAFRGTIQTQRENFIFLPCKVGIIIVPGLEGV